MTRRDFITLLGGAAAWPVTARAQQPRPPVVGVLYQAATDIQYFSAFLLGLREAGYVEGQNLILEVRKADRADQLEGLAVELVSRKVALIFAGGSEAVRAAQRATKIIPIVITSSDPVGAGLVTSLAHPGGNTTGVSHLSPELSGKRLQLLREVGGSITSVAVLIDPDDPPALLALKETEAAASTLGIRVAAFEVHGVDEIDAAFGSITKLHPDALIILAAPLLQSLTRRISDFALGEKLPSVFAFRSFVEGGGLMSYGTSLPDQYRRAAGYVDRILKGARPADLPIQQPVKFELVINLKTAKALGLTMPATLLAIADEVIE